MKTTWTKKHAKTARIRRLKALAFVWLSKDSFSPGSLVDSLQMTQEVSAFTDLIRESMDCTRLRP